MPDVERAEHGAALRRLVQNAGDQTQLRPPTLGQPCSEGAGGGAEGAAGRLEQAGERAAALFQDFASRQLHHASR